MLKKVGRDDDLDRSMLHYVYGSSKSALGSGFKCTEGKIRNQLMIAEIFLGTCIIISGATLKSDGMT